MVGLLWGTDGMPRDVNERGALAVDLIYKANEKGIPNEDIFIDPIATPICGEINQVLACTEFMGMLKDLGPGCKSTVGLSNVSNAVPHKNRPLINSVYCAMVMGAGLEMMIANPLEEELMEVIRVIEERDESTPLNKLYLTINDRIANMEYTTIDDVDMSDPEQAAVWKTVQILLNQVIYADSYLEQ